MAYCVESGEENLNDRAEAGEDVKSQHVDDISSERIRELLNYREGQVVVRDELVSTNLTAKQLAADGAGHGTVVVACRQSGGRGRCGRSFYSPKGTGLYFTVVLRRNLSEKDVTMITCMAAVAVCRVLRYVYGKEASIKWVNDIYIKDRKCCGILAELGSDPQTGEGRFVVVGIGINLFVPRGGFPRELQCAASVFEWGETVYRERFIARIVNEITDMYENLNGLDFMDEYRALNMVIGRDVMVIRDGERRCAKAVAITGEGHLVLKFAEGVEELSYGDVSVHLDM